MTAAAAALRVERLSVEFRTRSGLVRALDNVSFSVRKGETIALVGESGSGKSVTAYAIMGILDPAGRVTNGGPAWASAPRSSLIGKISSGVGGFSLLAV